jgi:hypothetical protein
MDDFGRMGALLRPVEYTALSNRTPEGLAALAREGYLSQIAVASAQTIRDQTVLFVDFNELNGQVCRTFRSIPSKVEPIVANLSLAKMDFAEFADNTNLDGIFCGFWVVPALWNPGVGARSAASRARPDERQDPREDVPRQSP